MAIRLYAREMVVGFSRSRGFGESKPAYIAK